MSTIASSFESCSVKVNTSDGGFLFSCIYRPPPSKKNRHGAVGLFLNEFSDLLDDFNREERLYIVGDFNLHVDENDEPCIKNLNSLLEDHNLKQLINEPTHDKRHTLDLLIVINDS